MTLKSITAPMGVIFALAMSAAAIMTITTAHAQSQEKHGLKINGYFTQSLNLVDIDDRDGLTLEDEVLTQNAEIHFNYTRKLDGGTVLGGHVQLEGATESDQIDEHYLSLTGDWGRLLLGAENGVGHLMQVRAPSFVPGLKMYDNSLTDEGLEDAYMALFGVDADTPPVINDAHMSTKLEHISGDANKISFITPKVGGTQFGLSFTPNNRDRNGSTDNQAATTTDDDLQEDIIELALSYSGRLGGVKYKFGYSAVQGDSLNGEIDPESNSAGVRIAWANYVVGANQSSYENLDQLSGTAYAANSAKIDTQNIGVRYRLSPGAQIGLGWTQSEESARNGDETTEYDEWMIGGGMRLGEGVRLGYYYSQSEAGRLAEDDSAEISVLGATIDLRF